MKRNELVRRLKAVVEASEARAAVKVLMQVAEVGTGSEQKAVARLLDSLKATAEELSDQPVDWKLQPPEVKQWPGEALLPG